MPLFSLIPNQGCWTLHPTTTGPGPVTTRSIGIPNHCARASITWDQWISCKGRLQVMSKGTLYWPWKCQKFHIKRLQVITSKDHDMVCTLLITFYMHIYILYTYTYIYIWLYTFFYECKYDSENPLEKLRPPEWPKTSSAVRRGKTKIRPPEPGSPPCCIWEKLTAKVVCELSWNRSNWKQNTFKIYPQIRKGLILSHIVDYVDVTMLSLHIYKKKQKHPVTRSFDANQVGLSIQKI